MNFDRIYASQIIMRQLCVVVAFVCSWMAIQSIVTGQPFGVLFVVEVMAIVGPCLLAKACDGKRHFGFELLDIRHQSWAYVFGDAFLLPASLMATTVIWQDQSQQMPHWVRSQWWFVAMATVTIVLSVALNVADTVRYRKYDATRALDNPGKVYHNWVVVPVLIGTLLITAVPVLFVEWSVWTAVVLSGVILWIVLVVVDDKLRFVNPHWQYRLWDAQRFAPLPRKLQNAVVARLARKTLDELERR